MKLNILMSTQECQLCWTGLWYSLLQELGKQSCTDYFKILLHTMRHIGQCRWSVMSKDTTHSIRIITAIDYCLQGEHWVCMPSRWTGSPKTCTSPRTTRRRGGAPSLWPIWTGLTGRSCTSGTRPGFNLSPSVQWPGEWGQTVHIVRVIYTSVLSVNIIFRWRQPVRGGGGAEWSILVLWYQVHSSIINT